MGTYKPLQKATKRPLSASTLLAEVSPHYQRSCGSYLTFYDTLVRPYSCLRRHGLDLVQLLVATYTGKRH